ncbi:MAG: hypothetical protein R3F61_12840 [Myxococcota bacterium]
MRSITALLFVVLFSLGCMGAFNSVTGLDIDLQFGEDAVHPADFPATAPAGGTPAMSMSMTASGDGLNLPEGVEVDLSPDQQYRMEIVVYEVSVSDAAARRDTAVQQAVAAGYTQSADDGTSILLQKDGTLFLVIDPEDQDEGSLSLMRLVPVEPDAD